LLCLLLLPWLQVLHMFQAQRKQYYLFEHVLQEQHQYGGQTS
jgi:hypothetical protein